MGYQAVADKVLLVLKTKTPASARVTNENSNAKGNWAVMAAGSQNWFVLTPGAFTRERIEMGAGGQDTKQNTWDVLINIIAKYDADEVVHDIMVAATQDIMDTLDAWPNLDGQTGVLVSDVIGGDEPTPLFGADGSGPHAVMRTLTCRVTEDVTVTVNE